MPVLSGVTLAGNVNAGKTTPNIVLILADDMGWGDVAVNGNTVIETPVLNKLASQSLSFSQFYACPLSAPTRAEMLTGRYFLRTGVSSVSQGYENMNPDEITLAEILKKHGYATGCFGKWHNGAYFRHHPNRQGFDEFFGFLMGHLGYYYDAIYQHNDEDVSTQGYSTDFFTEKAIGFIEQNKAKPFFCYVPYNVPHSPFQVPEKYFSKYKSKGLDNELATIYGMVENMDENIGLILNKLEQLDLRENTIVIFLSDNGPNTWRYNGNMKGKKGSVDEGGIRVPFYISWPGKIQAGTSGQLAQTIDIMPTLLTLCKIGDKPLLPMDGKDLSKAILKKSDPQERYIFSRQGHYPLQKCAGSVRNTRYRLVVSSKDTLLFDLINDPAQTKDISQNQSEIRKSLALAYLKWEKEMVGGYKPFTTIEAGFSEEEKITLPVQDAILSGKVKYSSIHPNQSHTENWVQNGDSLYWNLKMVQKGNYKVEIQYGCDDNNRGSKFIFRSSGGKVQFSFDRVFESVILPNRDYVERSESVERTWNWMDAGNVSIGKGAETLVLKLVERKSGDAGLIKAIRLTKI
ncbi:MAG: arylsulfatase [Bacteroidales bacterium]|nr:arylsulfatase [Bacteroidales bacterium]